MGLKTTEKNYLNEFVNKKNKTIYHSYNDLKENCLKNWKKLNCDLNILTSTNREYVPYYYYDYFLSQFDIENDNKKKINKNNICNTFLFDNKQVVCHKKLKEINIDAWIKLSLEKNVNIKYLTCVQYCLMPFFLNNYDLLVYSLKSTGKTLAYVLPLLHKIIIQIYNLKNKLEIKNNFVLALILCPNNLLVEQTYAFIKKIIMYHPYNIICHYMHGRKNQNMQNEIEEIKKKKPHILISTPVTFINHIKYTQNFKHMFFLCDTLILDEAYFLLNSNFLKNILIIKNVLPKSHQTILLTCVMNNFLKHISYRLLRLNYILLNFVHNCIYRTDHFYFSIKKNVQKFNSIEQQLNSKYSFNMDNSNEDNPNEYYKKYFSLELFYKLNGILQSCYKNNILNFTDLKKIWYLKDATTFYKEVNELDSVLHTNKQSLNNNTNKQSLNNNINKQ
uniref:ATP-dependent RNA helicase n=1 Tax=Piliocolobus tephrosceles TaxID=591936 RepID=A0A8C9HLN2_9PRIM